MGKISKAILFGLALLRVAPVLAQTPSFTFSYKNSASPAIVVVSPNGTIDAGPVAVGSSSLVSLTVSNKDTATWTITSILVNSPASNSSEPFQLTTIYPSSSGLAPGQDRTYGISFTPTARGMAGATFSFRLVSGSRTFNTDFAVTGSGASPNLICSYILSAEGNQILLGDNGTISFPRTQVGQSSTGTLILSNTGNAPGTVTDVTLPTGSFRVSGLPLLPAQIDAGKDMRFTVVFAPTASQNAAGVMRVSFADRSVTVNLSGQGIGASFVYEATAASSTSLVPNNGTISLPSATIGASSSGVVRVRNTGNNDGQVGAITIAGASFQLTNLPVLPATLSPGQELTFTIVFSPTQSGTAEGRLRIDSASFNVAGTGIGAVLSLAVTQGTTTTPLADNGNVSFPNTAVGSKSTAILQISNTGNSAAKLNSVNLIGQAYWVGNIPALPVTLTPGQRIAVMLEFWPSDLGGTTGLLQLDDLKINLSGVGLAPPALPPVFFTNLGDTAEAGQQPSVGLSLESAYPLDISGKLTIGFTSEAFVDDQAIQFSTGGRSVNFIIPAHTTEAIFGSGAKQLQFQTGTVAGTITLMTAFSTGTVSLTPAAGPSKSVVIAASAPRIRTVQIGTRTANNFEVIVSGFSTPRAVSELDLQFTPAAGSSLQTTSLNLNVDSAFSAWYQGASSAPSGSQFTAVINITVNGDVNAVQAVQVTAKNQRGASTPVSAALR